MPCSIVVGGQYGSEGKGKVVALLADSHREPWVVRCGGPNSGHTVYVDDREVPLRMVPAGVTNPNALLLLSAGCAVDPDLIVDEADLLGLPKERVIIDPRAVVLSSEDRQAENGAVPRIGSTASGTGAALIRRMQRISDAILVGCSEELRERFTIRSVAPLVHGFLAQGGNLVVEGTQGFGLSLLHGPHYPFVTARDTTASGFAAEVGLSPRQVDFITLTIRTFPIRVGGNSGPLDDEITWDTVREISGAPHTVPEYTTVTKRLRRVGRFDLDMVKRACEYNQPTSIAVMGLDRLDYINAGVREVSDLTVRARHFLRTVEAATRVPVEWIGTGFHTLDAISVASIGRKVHGSAAAR